MRIAIAGLGTVGSGILRLLHDNADQVAARAGRKIDVVAVSARDRKRDRGVSIETMQWFDDPVAMAAEPGLDAVVELIGGSDGPARAVVQTALRHGVPVVTANKALIAVHGTELAAEAERQNVSLMFEAAVAGGIPAIKCLREGLAGNCLDRVLGILNGTSNYILTAMESSGRDFHDVLTEAQMLGYAESDPSFDIDGIDTAHKLAILTALAFGRPVSFADIHVEGIRGISAMDIAFARELGYRVKLLGISQRRAHGVESRVHACMVPVSSELAHVDGVFNAVMVEGDFVGQVLMQGRGAGAGPTASAVAADLIDLARNRRTPVFGVPNDALVTTQSIGIGAHQGSFYLRLMVQDRPGVIACITAALRDTGISLESMLQRGKANATPVPVVLVTHDTSEEAVRAAMEKIAGLDVVLEAPTLIRIERD